MISDNANFSLLTAGELTLDLAYTVLDVLPAAVYVTDQDGRIVYYNTRAAELWGRSPAIGEMWCGSWKILNHDGSVMPHDECPMALTVKSQQPSLGYEIVVEKPDGSRALIAPNPRPLHNSAGEFVGAINMLIDVTDRRKAEAARKAAEDDAQRLSEELSQQYAITQVLAESNTLDEAASRILEMLCHAVGAQVSAMWMPTGRGQLKLICMVSTDNVLAAKYQQVVDTTPLIMGKDVPTQTLSSRKMAAINLAAAEETPRRNALVAAGFKSELVYPVQLREGAHVRGVLKFLFKNDHARDAAGMHLIEETALKLGQFIDRMDIERALFENDKRLEGFPLS
jgi:PAS domain S-box-containing protein